MDGGRGFFSSDAAPPGAGATRTRPVSANTRLRQKPPAASQDFFASLGIDPQTSRSRTGSSASTSSNRSFSNVTSRTGPLGAPPAPSPPPAPTSSLAASPQIGGWRSGGLAAQRTSSTSSMTLGGVQRPVSASMTFGETQRTSPSMKLTSGGLHRPASASSMTLTSPVAGMSLSTRHTATSVSSTTSIRGLSVSSVTSGATNARTLTGAAKTKPTQLFSMDTEELYSDDGWGVDSPTAVLSNPEESKQKETKRGQDEFAWADDDDAFASPVGKTATPAQPAQANAGESHVAFAHSSGVSASAAFEAKVESTPPANEFAWGDDDELLVSPVAKTTPAPQPSEQSAFQPVTTTESSFESKVDPTPPAPAAEFAWADDDEAFASPVAKTAAPAQSSSTTNTSITSNTITFAAATGSSSVSAFETKTESAFPTPADEFAWADDDDAFASPVAKTGAPLLSQPPTSSANAFGTATESVGSMQAGSEVATSTSYRSSEPYHQPQSGQWEPQHESRDHGVVVEEKVTAASSMVTTVTSSGTIAAPPVELTSPGGAAAGEYWGDANDDELFDHDDHADEEWDETIKATQSVSTADKPLVGSSGTSLPSHDTSFNLSAPPLPPGAMPIKEGEPTSEQKADSFVNASLATSSMTQAQEELATQPSEVIPEASMQSSDLMHGIQETRAAPQFDAHSSPFSNAIAAHPTNDEDPNVFPDVPPSASFVHTPTGTGGPFGRVPSSHGKEDTSFQEEFPSSTALNEDAKAAGEVQVMESVTWDTGSVRSNHGPSDDTAEHDDDTQHAAHHGQDDEEERDSVVSFSGSNSFFPSTGRPSSLYGGSQSSFASHRMYQSSTASTDHDGSSIASVGVSSAGATFGGSERVSEGGAFSDGTVSETPSLVDSSNASTAFGTDFPSVSEGQFSAPGTTIGGSDNASDGGFSDGNASETTSMCESVNTNPRFVSEFSSSSGHYVTESVEHRDVQEPFASSAATSDMATTHNDVEQPSAFGGDDSSADANPFANASSSAFPPAQSAPAPAPTVAQADNVVEEASVPTASSLFGATAGADVPNPFSSFGAAPALPTTAVASPIQEHELPTSAAGDLFGAGPPSSEFGTAFRQPTHNAYNTSYQTQQQSYSQTSHRDYSGGYKSAHDSAEAQFSSSSPFDRPAVPTSNSNSFQDQRSSNFNGSDPFSTRSGAQHGFGSQASYADSMFSSGGYNNSANTQQFGGSGQATADAVFGGQTPENNSSASSSFGQQSTAGAFDTYGRDQTSSRYDQSGSSVQAAAAFGGQIGVPNHFSRQSSASSFTSNSAQHEPSGYASQNRYHSQQFGQSSTPSTPDNYSRQSAADAFARGSSAQTPQGYSSSQQFGATQGTSGYGDHVRSSSSASADAIFGRSAAAAGETGATHFGQTQGASGRYGDHSRTSSSASADAYFGRSAATTGASAASAGSPFAGDRAMPPSLEPANHHASPQPHASSFSRTGSNLSSYSAQASLTPKQSSQSFGHMQGVRTPSGSVESTTFSRHGSNSSMSQHGDNAPSHPSKNQQHHARSTPVAHKADAAAFFDQSSSAATASSFFGSGTSEQPLEMQSNDGYANEATQPYDPGHPMGSYEHQDHFIHGESSQYGYGNDNAAPAPAPVAETDPNTGAGPVSEAPSVPEPSYKHDEYDNAGATDLVAQEDAASRTPNEINADRPQAFDGFGNSSQASSDFFSSAPMPQERGLAAHQPQQSGYGNEPHKPTQHQAHDAYSQAQASYQHQSAAPYGTEGAHVPETSAGNYFESGGNGTDISANGAYSQQYQQQQYQPDSHSYGDEPVRSQPQTTDYRGPKQAYGAPTTTGYGYGADQGTYHAATPEVKTSNKYKDPCVAPPSCLASFGFGGNVVTMFPKRKLRLNISSFRNSPRGAPAPAQSFENNGELRKGPVNVYHMCQLHPNDKEFEQMDVFPGPLTEDVSDEVILEYIDDRLKRSEACDGSAWPNDENDRLLLGVLRVLVKYNGKLRSDPGAANPRDPNAPEAQLVALLSESSKRRQANEATSFPAHRRAHAQPHPDLAVKHANKLRELLLVGDRKGAVSTAMSAYMWPEAMLIASFTDKEEYRRVLRTYLDENYATGDPCRALFMSFADQQEKCVQEPKRLLQTSDQQAAASLILSNWVPHAQVLLANRTADTNKILTELGDRLWGEENAVAAAHICYLLAGIQVEAPMLTSKIALLGGDHRNPNEARFYVSPTAVQRTEIYEWAQKHSGASSNLMIPFQGYKLIYAMSLADHGKMETAFKYVTSMLTVIKAVTATMKPGTSMYLEGMKNQLTVLDDRLRQHLGQDRVASVAASTSRGGGRKQGKWGLGSALSIMGKIVNRVVEGGDANATASSASNAAAPGGLYANEATPPAASYPSNPTVTTPSPNLPQQIHQTPPTSSHGPSPVPAGSYGHATPPMSQGSAPGSSNGYNRAPFARSSATGSGIPPSGPFSGNGRPGLQHQLSSGPFSGNGKTSSGPPSQGRSAIPPLHSQHLMEPPGSNRSVHSNHSATSSSMPQAPMPRNSFHHQQQQQPLPSQTLQYPQDAQPARAAPPALNSASSLASQPKPAVKAAEAPGMLQSTPADAMSSGPASDKGKSSPRMKKPARSKTPPPSGSSKTSGWLSGLSSFIATKMNPEAKVAKLGEHMEAYFDEETKRWVFPGETASEEPAMPSAPPTGPMPGSAPGSTATGMPPVGTNSAPGSISSGPTPSNDPLAALMAPPASHMLMKKDPLAAMMAPPARYGAGPGARRGGPTAQRKPPRPQFAVFKPTGGAPDQQSE